MLWRVGSWEKVRALPWDSSDWMPLFFAPREPHRLFTQHLVANVETEQVEQDWQQQRLAFSSARVWRFQAMARGQSR